MILADGDFPQDAAKNRYGMPQGQHGANVPLGGCTTICHATEREELLLEVMEALTERACHF